MSPLLLHGNSNQYLHRDVSHTDMLQPHFISCRGVSGARGNMRGSRNLHLSVLFSPQLIYRGSPLVLLLRKLYLYFTKDPEGVHYFPRGGVSNLFQGGGGPNANFFRNPYTYLLFSRGGGSGPPIPLWICTWAMSS